MPILALLVGEEQEKGGQGAVDAAAGHDEGGGVVVVASAAKSWIVSAHTKHCAFRVHKTKGVLGFFVRVQRGLLRRSH